ncbi:MAG TPA: hypothetical protein VF611_14220 [Pyrinomonadaceae bacterium]|jgi:hypothetical protein
MFKTAAGIVGDLLDFGQEVLRFAGEVLRSRLGLILFLLHLALFSCAYVAQGYSILATLDSGGDSHASLAFYLVNFPMLIATFLVTTPVLYERRVEEFGALQWAAVTFIFFCVLFQWWVYGYLAERLIRRGGRPSTLPRP